MTTDGATKDLRPADLANQLFDAAVVQFKNAPREAGMQVISFLAEALVYALSSMPGDEALKRELFKSVGESIVGAFEPESASGTSDK